MNTQPTEEGWEKEFREVFEAAYPTVEDAARGFASFIESLLAAQELKIRKEYEKK